MTRTAAHAPLTHLLYLHGFRSSPRSNKAQMVGAAVASQGLVWASPQLPPSPAQAMALIEQITESWPADSMAVVGSSLGGFYATVLAQRKGCRAAVINPAVAPARDLANYIGEQSPFDRPEDRIFFLPEFVGELQALAPYPITRPHRYWALVARGDEVLHAPEMVAHYPGVSLKLIPGSDHAMSDFADHLPSLMAWLGPAEGG